MCGDKATGYHYRCITCEGCKVNHVTTWPQLPAAFAVSLFWSRRLLFSRDSSGGQSRRIWIQLMPVSTRANVLLTKWPETSARNVASRSALQWEWQQTVSGLSNRIFYSCLYIFYVTFAFLPFFNWKKRILAFIYRNKDIYEESAELVTKSTKMDLKSVHQGLSSPEIYLLQITAVMIFHHMEKQIMVSIFRFCLI